MSDAKKIAAKLLEKLLPAGATDAERAALRADPAKYKQYLNALDEVEGPRAERARKMGFSDETYYHGTDKNIEAFKNSGDGRYGKGVYAANFAELPNAFAGDGPGGNVMPLKLKLGNEMKANSPASTAVIDLIKKEYPQVYDQMKNNEDFVRGNAAMERQFRREVGPDASQALIKKAGYDSITDKFGEAVVSPSQVRSTNAAFDPRFKDSADILAATSQPAKTLGGLIASRVPRPSFGLGEAFNQINEPLEALNEPRNRAIEIAAQALGKQMDVSGGKVEGLADQNAAILNQVGQFVIPASQDVAMGPLNKVFMANKAAKAATTAEKLAAAVDKGFGKTVVKDTATQGYGSVKKLFIEPPKHLGALESTAGGVKRGLKMGTGSGI